MKKDLRPVMLLHLINKDVELRCDSNRVEVKISACLSKFKSNVNFIGLKTMSKCSCFVHKTTYYDGNAALKWCCKAAS